MDPEKRGIDGVGYSQSHKVIALVAILLILFGGGWASLAPGGAGLPAGSAGPELTSMIRGLSPEALSSLDGEEAAKAAEDLLLAARLAGVDPREALEEAFPSPRQVLGMLALDRDVDDFLEYAEREDAAGDYYREEARAAQELRPIRSRYEDVFSSANAALGGTAYPAAAKTGSVLGTGKRPYLASPRDVWLPPKRELPLSHPYALDVFFHHVERSGEAERGPTIRALYPGIVIAAASDWSGGQGITTWRSGGLSPAAGNGVIIYDPATRRYLSYFHLSSVSLRVGELVRSGDAIGRGGNSGMNARKAGHGEHVHVEIFDSDRGESLSAYEILEMLKG